MSDDKVPHSEQPAGGSDLSRRSFVYGSAAAAGAAALFGRTPLGRTALRPPLRHRAPLPQQLLAGSGGFTLNQHSSQVNSANGVTFNLPTHPSTAGSLLVVTVVAPSAATGFTPPDDGVGWQLAKVVTCSGGRVEQWYVANSPANKYGPNGTGAVFNLNGYSCLGGIAEFFPPPGTIPILETMILDTVGNNFGSSSTTNMPVSSAGGVFAGALGVFSQAEFYQGKVPTGYSWNLPNQYSELAGLHNGLPNVWSHSWNGNLNPGSQTPAGGFTYTPTPDTSNGWAAALCCYRAVTVAPIGVVGGEPTNCLDLDPTGQQLIVGGDVEGCWRTANFGDNWQPANYGGIVPNTSPTQTVLATAAQTSFADIKWSLLEDGVIYACVGKTGSGYGAFLASQDGGCTWAQRNDPSNQLLFFGNGTPDQSSKGPRPTTEGQDTDRTVNRLIAQDPVGDSQGHKYLYLVTANQGVMRSSDNGVTWETIGFNNKNEFPRCIVINPEKPWELWVGVWNNGGYGGVYHTTTARASGTGPTWTQLGGYTGTVADLKVLNVGSSTYLYAACAGNGIFQSVNSADLVSLNGSPTTPVYGGPQMNAIDTTTDPKTGAPRSIWVSIDGYQETVNNLTSHQIIAGCSGGVPPIGQDNNYTNIVQLGLIVGTTTVTYADLTGPANINIATLPPFNNAWWHDPPPPLGPTSWQFWLGGKDSVNPHVLIDPNTVNNPNYPLGPAIYLCNSGGFFRSTSTTNGNRNWQLAVTGMPMIGHNCFAIDPNAVGTNPPGTHFVHCGNDYTSIDVNGDPSGDTPADIVATDPASNVVGGNLTGGHRESHAIAIDPTTSQVYVGLNYAYSQPTGGAVLWRPQAVTDSQGNLTQWNDTGYAATLDPTKPHNNAPAVIGLIAGTANKQPWAVAIAQGIGPYYWDGSNWRASTEVVGDPSPPPGKTGNVGQHIPMVAGNGGYLYCFDRTQGIYRSTDYGATWKLIQSATANDARSGWLTANPTASGELWFSTIGGTNNLFKMTQAGGSPSVSPITANGKFSAGAAGIAFTSSGTPYVIALPGAPPAPPVTTVYYLDATTGNWLDWTGGDGSFGSYGPPAGQLGISSAGWMWITGGEHFGCWGMAT